MVNVALPIGSYRSISVEKLPSGRWRARARIRDLDGRTRQAEAHGRTKSGARDRLAEALTSRQAPSTLVRRDMRVSDLVPLWLARVANSEDLAPSSLSLYGSTAKKIVCGPDGIGGWRLYEVTPQRLSEFLDRVYERVPGRAKTTRVVLRKLFQFAVLNAGLSSNPVRDLAAAAKKPSPEVRALTSEERERLAGAFATQAHRVRPGPMSGTLLPDALVVLSACGCRLGELLAIRVCDWDRRSRQLEISGTIPNEGKTVRQPHTKTESGLRKLVIPRWAVPALDQRVRLATDDPQALLFATRTGRPMAPANFRRRWRTAITASEYAPELDGITPKHLRKSVATELAKVDRAAAAAQLGHANEATLVHYVPYEVPVFDNSDGLLGLNPEARLEADRLATLRALAGDFDTDIYDGGTDVEGRRVLVLSAGLENHQPDTEAFASALAPNWPGQEIIVLDADSPEATALRADLAPLWTVFS